MAKAQTSSFTNQPKYDPAGKGIDYGEATEYDHAAMDKADEQGFYGEAPGAELDGDLTVAGVAGRDVVADSAKAKEEAAEAPA